MGSHFHTQAAEFLAQKRIAVAGVSGTGRATGNFIYRALRKRGYEVFPLNPKAPMVEGDACFRSVADIPGGVDGVVVVTRPEQTAAVVRDCVEAGIARVWMHDNTLMGSSVSPAAAAHARDNGLTVIEGGCPMMFIDLGHKCLRAVLGLFGRLPD